MIFISTILTLFLFLKNVYNLIVVYFITALKG